MVVDNVEDKPHNKGIDAEEAKPENKSSDEFWYSGPTHEDVPRLICETVEERDGRRLYC